MDRTAKIEALANEMGVSASDLTAFANCLSVWTSKGFSISEAIERHMSVMCNFANNAVAVSKTAAAKELAVNTFFPAN